MRPGLFTCALICLSPSWAGAAIELAVDANRDGIVVTPLGASRWVTPDRTEAGKPYIFWRNDDQDDKEHYESWPIRKPDYRDEVIGSARDMEDFSRLHVRFTKAPRPGDGLQFFFGAVAGSPAIKLFPSEDLKGRDEYLTDPDGAALQLQPPFVESIGEVRGGKGVLRVTVQQALGNRGGVKLVPLLFEGSSLGYGELRVQHLRGGKVLATSAPVHLEIRHVKQMYVRVNSKWPLRAKPWDVLSASPVVPTPQWEYDPMDYEFVPSWDEEEPHIVWVYGWLKSGDNNYRTATRQCGETVFKRLWHRGYRGRLTLFRWETRKHTLAMGLKQSEYRAYKFGPTLRNYVATIPQDRPIFVTAHSLGGVVLLEALKEGMKAKAALFQQAAVPAAALDPDPELVLPVHAAAPRNGYDGYLKGSNVPIYSLYNARDVTWVGWNLVQAKFKPHKELTRKYVPGPDGSGEGARLRYWWFFSRPVEDPHEQLAFIDKSRSNPLGAEARTGGAVHYGFDVDGAGFRFGAGHVSQWSLNPQKTTNFYTIVLDLFGLKYNGVGK